MKLWMCVDAGDKLQSGFKKDKQDAERYVANNRGYDMFHKCKADGWADDAVEIDVPAVVAAVLLQHCTR